MLDISYPQSFAIIEMQHGKVNAMDLEFCRALADRLEALARENVSAVILRGRPRVFSAGIDLKRWLGEGPSYVEPFLRQLERLFETVFCFPKPFISQINGHAIAGGCMIATAGDFRVIDNRARIGLLESRLGVPLPLTAIEIVRHVATADAFRRLVTTGAEYAGEDAVQAGLADQVADESAIEQVAFDAAEAYAAIPLPVFQFTKRQMREPAMRNVRQNHELLFAGYLEIWQSAQTRSTIREYVRQRLNFSVP